MPIAVAPTPAVLPIRQTSTQTRPAGIDLRVPTPVSPDAFYRAPAAGAPVPLAVPAYDRAGPAYDHAGPAYDHAGPAYDHAGPAYDHDVPAYDRHVPAKDADVPSYDGDTAAYNNDVSLFDDARPVDAAAAPPRAPAELAAPVTAALDPAEWGLDIEAAPASGRRRGAEAEDASSRRPKSATKSSVPLPARLFGRGKAGAARLLVLALVVGAEGVAVTSMVGQAKTAPVDPSTDNITGAYQFSALDSVKAPTTTSVQDSAEQQQLAIEAEEDALALKKAQDAASKAKVTTALKQAKSAADRVQAAADRRAAAAARAARDAQRDPRALGRTMAAARGWGDDQFSCLNKLWNRESQWNYKADNPSSSAYGIPQALPGYKMASAGSDWRTNPVTQIKWGLDYISDAYGTPCAAWAHSEAVGSY